MRASDIVKVQCSGGLLAVPEMFRRMLRDAASEGGKRMFIYILYMVRVLHLPSFRGARTHD